MQKKSLKGREDSMKNWFYIYILKIFLSEKNYWSDFLGNYKGSLNFDDFGIFIEILKKSKLFKSILFYSSLILQVGDKSIEKKHSPAIQFEMF